MQDACVYAVYYMCNFKYVINCLLYISKIKRILTDRDRLES